MKSKLRNVIIIIFLPIFLFSCTIYTSKDNKSTSEIDPLFQEDKLKYTDIIGDTELAEEFFKEVLNLKNLDSHIFYYSQGQYNFVIKFNSSVTSIEIDSFMSYFSHLFISMHMAPIGGFPYGNELIAINDNILHSKDKPYEKLSLRVYINDIKAFRYDYTFKDLKQTSYKYWENVYNDYNFKALKSKSAKDFIKKNNNLSRTINIRKTFKNDGAIIVNVKSDKKFRDSYVKKIKEKIEYDLAPDLEKEAFDKYNTNNQYLGIILQFQVENNIYQEYVYYNGKDEDKGWINVNWMEYKFLTNYIQN